MKKFVQTICFFLLLCFPGSLPRAADGQTAPVILGFQGEGGIGRNASSTIYLNTWSTMRRSPWPNPDRIDFGNSITLWNSEVVEPYTHERASEMAKEWGAHLAIWGRAHEYAGGLLIESKITVPEYKSPRGSFRKASWQVVYADQTFRVDFPNRQFNWPNIVLSKKVVSQLSMPFGMPIYAARDSETVVGQMSPYVVATRFVPGAAKISDRGVEGWIRFPALDNFEKPGVVLLAGGIVRLIRGDYDGAESFFSQLLEQTNDLSATSEIDLLLLRGRAKELSGESGMHDFKRAFERNPYSSPVIEHFAAGLLSRNRDLPEGDKISELKNFLSENSAFLDSDSDFRKF